MFTFTVIVALVAMLVPGEEATCPRAESYTLKLNVHGLRNFTGHWEKDVKLDFDGPRPPKSWDIDFEEIISTADQFSFTAIARVFGGTQASRAPPAPLHVYRADIRNYTDAAAACKEIGARLAIINSDEEAEALRELVLRTRDPRSTYKYSFLGFDDIVTEGTFITVLGQPLSLSGYFTWAFNEPSNSRIQIANGPMVTENCGSMSLEGLLNDSPCHARMPFICEFDDLCSL